MLSYSGGANESEMAPQWIPNGSQEGPEGVEKDAPEIHVSFLQKQNMHSHMGGSILLDKSINITRDV